MANQMAHENVLCLLHVVALTRETKKCLLNPKRNTAINIFQDEIIKNTLLFWCELLKMPLIVHIIITLSTG